MLRIRFIHGIFSRETNRTHRVMSIHPSHYFEIIERFIYSYGIKCSITVLKKLAIDQGCPNEIADQVINGAIVDYLMNYIAPKDENITIVQHGIEVTSDCKNPTITELMSFMTKDKFTDLSIERAEKLVSYLIEKSALMVDYDGRLFLINRLIPRKFVEL